MSDALSVDTDATQSFKAGGSMNSAASAFVLGLTGLSAAAAVGIGGL